MAENNNPISSAGENIEKAEKAAGLVESMGCCCLNLGCLLLVLMMLSLLALIVGVVENPLVAVMEGVKSLWHAITGTGG